MQPCEPNFQCSKMKNGEEIGGWGGVLAGRGVEWDAGAFVQMCGGVCVREYVCVPVYVCMCARAYTPASPARVISQYLQKDMCYETW